MGTDLSKDQIGCASSSRNSGCVFMSSLYTVQAETSKFCPPLAALLRVCRARMSQNVSVWKVLCQSAAERC